MMTVRPLVFGAFLVVVQLLAGADASSSRGGADQAWSPEGPATRTVSFRRDVAPVLTVSCTTPSCHGGPSRPPVLPTTGDVHALRAALVGVPSEDRPALAYVEPGDPGDSYLLQKVEGHLLDALCTEHDCGSRMPLDNPPLASRDVAAVRAWIVQGAPDN